MLTSVSIVPARLFTVITYGTSCPRVTLSSGVVLEIAMRAGELRIERDVVVEDLARARHLAAVQHQVDVVDRAGAAWRNRCSRRELRRLHFAEQGRARNRIVGAARAGRHRERCGRSAGRRRDDLRIARNVVRSRRRRHPDEVITAARAGRVAEVDVELVIAVRERDLPLLGRIVEAARRQGRGAAWHPAA